MIEIIENEDLYEFYKMINEIDMWGGAGAVWEVYIENEIDAREFESRMLQLIVLMENTKIKGKGIQPIKKLFEGNLNSKRNALP